MVNNKRPLIKSSSLFQQKITVIYCLMSLVKNSFPEIRSPMKIVLFDPSVSYWSSRWFGPTMLWWGTRFFIIVSR